MKKRKWMTKGRLTLKWASVVGLRLRIDRFVPQHQRIINRCRRVQKPVSLLSINTFEGARLWNPRKGDGGLATVIDRRYRGKGGIRR